MLADIFIAFFGGLYFLTRCAIGVCNEKASRAYCEKNMTREEEVKEKYAVSFYGARDTRRYILYYKNKEEIYNLLEDDFRYVFGNNWQRCVFWSTSAFDIDDSAEFSVYGQYCAHWIYNLLLAEYGKIDENVLNFGLCLGGPSVCERNIRFVECIERRLIKAGVQNIRFAQDLTLCSDRKKPGDLIGGMMVIEGLGSVRTYRLWENYFPVGK